MADPLTPLANDEENNDLAREGGGGRLQALLTEWQRLHTSGQQSFTRIFNTITVAAAALGIIVANSDKIEGSDAAPVIFVALPLVYTVIFSLIIEQLWLMVFEGYQIRRLEIEIGHVTNLTDLFISNWLVGHGHYSVTYASKRRLLSYSVIFLAVASAYFGIVIYAVIGLHGQHWLWWWIAILVACYLVVISIVIAAFISALLDTGAAFSRALQALPKAMDASGQGAVRPLPWASFIRDFLAYVIMPRPFDFIIKLQAIVIGFVAALAVSYARGDHITDHLGTTEVWKPFLLAVILLEVIVNQAKYVINDSHDRYEDATHPVQKTRFLAKYSAFVAPVYSASFGFFARVVVGIGVVVWLLRIDVRFGWLGLVAVIIVVHQLLYDWRFKHSSVGPKTLFTSVSYVGRAAVGVAMGAYTIGVGVPAAIEMAAYIAAWTMAFEAVALAGYWRAEWEAGVSKRAGLISFGEDEGFHSTSLVALCCISAAFPFVLVGPHVSAVEEWRVVIVAGAVGAMLLASRWLMPRGWTPLPLLIGVAFAAAVVGIAAMVVDWGNPEWVWGIAFSIFSVAFGVFFNRASYAQLTLQFPPLGKLCGHLYQRLFALGQWTPPRGA